MLKVNDDIIISRSHDTKIIETVEEVLWNNQNR